MKVALLLGIIVVAICLLQADAGYSHLSSFIKRLNAQRTSKASSILAKLKKKAEDYFKNKGYTKHESKSKESEDESVDESYESFESEEESQNQSEDVDGTLDTLYDELCSATCQKNDLLCRRVLYKYVRPLCRYKDASKAVYALRHKIGCINMAYRVKLICRVSKKSSGCKYAKKVKAFCDAGKNEDASTTASTTSSTTSPTTSPTTSATTSPTTSATTSSTTSATTSSTSTPMTTTFDPFCDSFTGICRDSCLGDETDFDTCDNGERCCVAGV
ncbi:hypothetical protein SNE40_006631 [Patella caerulea]|uniref:Uncharacterized protein n=1 Tax=Patella caerulea TaxID=87958 RepID=A0AAN8K484_PATCE